MTSQNGLDMSRIVFFSSVALAALVALIVSAMNADRVEVELAFLRLATPLGLALVVAFAAIGTGEPLHLPFRGAAPAA